MKGCLNSFGFNKTNKAVCDLSSLSMEVVARVLLPKKILFLEFEVTLSLLK